MDVKISKPSRQCTRCGKEFADEEMLTTALVEHGDDERFERHDICNACWPKESPDAFHCFWSNTFSEKRKPALMDTDTLWQVFHRAHSKAENDPSVLPFLYVAALGLVRLRQLVMEDSTRDKEGVEIMTLRTKGKKRVDYQVPVPVLRSADVSQIEQEISDFASDADADDQASGDDSENDDD